MHAPPPVQEGLTEIKTRVDLGADVSVQVSAPTMEVVTGCVRNAATCIVAHPGAQH